jgi:hypothetical protein
MLENNKGYMLIRLNLLFENLNSLIVSYFWMVKISPYFHKSIWVAILVCFFNFFVPKTYVFESFTWGIVHMDFVGFPFENFKLKNDINYIYVKTSISVYFFVH